MTHQQAHQRLLKMIDRLVGEKVHSIREAVAVVPPKHLDLLYALVEMNDAVVTAMYHLKVE